MKIPLWPKTSSGKCAAVLSIAFIVLIALKILCAIHLPTFFIAALGLFGFVFGVTAVIKRERALMAFLSVPVGLVIILWIAAELIYPH